MAESEKNVFVYMTTTTTTTKSFHRSEFNGANAANDTQKHQSYNTNFQFFFPSALSSKKKRFCVWDRRLLILRFGLAWLCLCFCLIHVMFKIISKGFSIRNQNGSKQLFTERKKILACEKGFGKFIWETHGQKWVEMERNEEWTSEWIGSKH